MNGVLFSLLVCTKLTHTHTHTYIHTTYSSKLLLFCLLVLYTYIKSKRITFNTHIHGNTLEPDPHTTYNMTTTRDWNKIESQFQWKWKNMIAIPFGSNKVSLLYFLFRFFCFWYFITVWRKEKFLFVF